MLASMHAFYILIAEFPTVMVHPLSHMFYMQLVSLLCLVPFFLFSLIVLTDQLSIVLNRTPTLDEIKY